MQSGHTRGFSRSYGKRPPAVQLSRRAALWLALGALLTPAAAAERPVRIVVLGDSLSAGFGLAVQDALPAKLEKALKAKGLPVEIANAGVSGDTAAGGLARLDRWCSDEERLAATDLEALFTAVHDELAALVERIDRR